MSGPVIVTVAGGEMPETQIPSMEGTTGLVEFHLYDRNAGPVRMPATEIPLDPDSTISLNEFLPVGVDPVSGVVFIKGDTGPEGPQGPQGEQGEIGPQGDIGKTGPRGEQGAEGPQGEQGDIGPQGEQGDQGEPGVDGIDGTGIEVKDVLDSEDDLPESGVEGDAYLIDRISTCGPHRHRRGRTLAPSRAPRVKPDPKVHRGAGPAGRRRRDWAQG